MPESKPFKKSNLRLTLYTIISSIFVGLGLSIEHETIMMIVAALMELFGVIDFVRLRRKEKEEEKQERMNNLARK